MFNENYEGAFQRAYHLKQHIKKLGEIRNKSNSLDNILPLKFQKMSKSTGTREILWTKKIIRENEILLNKLIDIKVKKFKIPKYNVKNSSVKVNSKVNNADVFKRIANANPCFSTKELLRDYSKHRQYIDRRNKIMNSKINSLKKLQKDYSFYNNESEFRLNKSLFCDLK